MERAQQADNSERRLQDLLAYAREDLGIELKGWLDLTSEDDKANLAQALLAIANHGGGYVILGFSEKAGNWVPAEPRPADLSSYTQDRVNGIVQGYAEPSFHCDVYHVAHPQSGDLFPIVVVPGGHKVPIRSKRDGPSRQHVLRNTYYIRRPGPASESPQSGREWDDLINRCVRANRDELLDSIRAIFYRGTPPAPITEENARAEFEDWIRDSRARWESLVAERSAAGEPFKRPTGVYSVAYTIAGDFQPRSLDNLLEILKEVKGHETGWPPWWVPTRDEIRPYPYNGLIECWLVESLFADPAHSDFWRASPRGMMFLLRGYEDDSNPDRVVPGTTFDLTLPIWRVGECLLHAERLAMQLVKDSATITFRIAWEGLLGVA